MLIKKEEKMMSKRKKKGFTLIELIVVIAILGILAAVAIPRLGGFSDSSKVSAIEADHKMLVNAVTQYYSENSAWPTTNALFVTDVEPLLNDTIASLQSKTGATFTWSYDAATDTGTLTTTCASNAKFVAKYPAATPLQYVTK